MCMCFVTEWEEPGIWSPKIYILYFVLVCILACLSQYCHRQQGLPWWSRGWDSAFVRPGAQVRFLVGELDPRCHNEEFACHN